MKPIGYIPTPAPPAKNSAAPAAYVESETAFAEIRAHGETVCDFSPPPDRLRTPKKPVNFFSIETVA